MGENVKIVYYGHSCFKIEYQNESIVLDPFDSSSMEGYDYLDIVANKVLCSHQHFDHNCDRVVKLLVFKQPSNFTINTIETYHDNANGKLRGMNLIHLIEVNGIKIAHFGDLGCDLNIGQTKSLLDIDVALIPVGGHYTIDAKMAKHIANKINPTLVIPMHYKGDGFGFDVLSTVNDYLLLCDDVIAYDSDTIEITKGMLKQTAVLKGRAVLN